MRPVRLSLNATGFSQWVPIDYIESWFGTTVGVVPSEDWSATSYTLQFALDAEIISAPSSGPGNPVAIARSGTTATVTWAGPDGLGHGLTTGDNVIIKKTGSPYLDSPVAGGAASTQIPILAAANTFGKGEVGWQVASTPSPTTFTYAVQNLGPAADQGTTTLARMRVFNHATLATIASGRANGTLNYPVRNIRLAVAGYSAGFVDLLVLQGTQT